MQEPDHLTTSYSGCNDKLINVPVTWVFILEKELPHNGLYSPYATICTPSASKNL